MAASGNLNSEIRKTGLGIGRRRGALGGRSSPASLHDIVTERSSMQQGSSSGGIERNDTGAAWNVRRGASGVSKLKQGSASEDIAHLFTLFWLNR